MAKYSEEDYEFEKNKQAILGLTKEKNFNRPTTHQSLWEYEITEHRQRKKRERFLLVGAWMGILSFLMTCLLLVNCFFEFIG